MFTSSARETDTSHSPLHVLHHVVRRPNVRIQHPPVLFLLHGAGSNENDLFSFAGRIPDEWLVVSVRAPFTVSEEHYKWYDVQLVENRITINAAQEEESRKTLLQWMDAFMSYYDADRDRVVVSGFSQGANMALAAGLTAPENVRGFAMFSGRFLEEIRPMISTSASLQHLRCFLAHGNRDNMLPIAYATENRQILQGLGIGITFSEDSTGHSISPKQFADFLLWLNQF